MGQAGPSCSTRSRGEHSDDRMGQGCGNGGTQGAMWVETYMRLCRSKNPAEEERHPFAVRSASADDGRTSRDSTTLRPQKQCGHLRPVEQKAARMVQAIYSKQTWPSGGHKPKGHSQSRAWNGPWIGKTAWSMGSRNVFDTDGINDVKFSAGSCVASTRGPDSDAELSCAETVMSEPARRVGKIGFYDKLAGRTSIWRPSLALHMQSARAWEMASLPFPSSPGSR